MVKILPKKFRRAVRKMRETANYTGWYTAILYETLPRNTILRATIKDTELSVRAGSPDLQVAIECITSEYTFLPDYIEDRPGNVIIDAGAYIGSAALVFTKQFPNATVVCVEPSSENLAILRKNVSSNPNIDIRSAALTATSSSDLMLRNRGTGQWGFTIIQAPQDKIEPAKIENVKTLGIDDLLNEFGENVILLKLDIEGAEKDIFENASPILKEVPYIFVELHDNIVSGCKDAFFKFSSDREIMNFSGEKYLSVKR